ncbi:hypothetical protein ACSSVY_002936 [Roseovarius sp. MBR-51]
MTTTTDAKPETAARGLLAGYVTRAELAAEWNCHERTIARYEAMPDGLPFLYIGGRKLYRIEDARRFMDSRIVTPNPVRKGAA